MKTAQRADNPTGRRRLRCLIALVAAVIFAIVIPLPENVLASAAHQSAPHGELVPVSPGESEPATEGELNRGQEQTAHPGQNVPGPGAFLGVLLKRLAAASAESDAGIKKLVAGLPQVFPDLNKVLVAL